jgi:hypothetical protein
VLYYTCSSAMSSYHYNEISSHQIETPKKFFFNIIKFFAFLFSVEQQAEGKRQHSQHSYDRSKRGAGGCLKSSKSS